MALGPAAAAAALAGGSVHAQSVGTFGADITAAAGYSTSPYLTSTATNTGSGYGEITINPYYAIREEAGRIDLDANYRQTFYEQRYGNSENYGASASVSRILDPLTQASGSLTYTSAIIGERGDLLGPVDPTDPDIDPEDPDLGLIGLRSRRNQFSAGASISTSISERDQINFSASASRSSYNGVSDDFGSDFTAMSGTMGYTRTLSERSSVGATVSVQRITYADNPLFNSKIYQPQATYSRQLSQNLSLNLALGALFIESATPGGSTSGFSGNGDLCYRGDRNTACLSAFSDASGTGFGGVRKRQGATVSASYQLGENDYLRGSATYTTYSEGAVFQLSREYILSNLNWDKTLTDRLAGGLGLSYRQVSGGVFDEGQDFSIRAFLRYRIGRRQ